MLLAFDIEEARRDTDRERSGDQKDYFEQDGEAVDSHHAVKAIDVHRAGHLKTKRDESEGDANEREVRGELALAIRQNDFHHQRHARSYSQDQLGGDQS